MHTLTARNIAEINEYTAIEAWVETAVACLDYLQQPAILKKLRYSFELEDAYIYSGKRRKRNK